MFEKTDAIEIGGGYAGVIAANRLPQRNDLNTTLINPLPTFGEWIQLEDEVTS